jgi:methyltransferase-like protein
MSKLNSLAISDNGFIFKPSTGESYTTNEMGLFIIQLLKENKSGNDIIQAIMEDFEVDSVTAGRDLYEYLDFLKREQMMD